ASIRLFGLRYQADFEALITKPGEKKKSGVKAQAVDISSTGMLVQCDEQRNKYKVGDIVKLRFDLPPGTMPEGFESRVKMNAEVVRTFTQQESGEEKQMLAFSFEQPLTDYFQKKRWGYSVYTASLLMFFSVCFILLLRFESFIYFKYNMVLYI